MVEVSEGFKYACLNGTVKNEITIAVFYERLHDNIYRLLTIKNEKIIAESLVIEQSICDESELKFGGAIASSFEVEIADVEDLTGKAFVASINQKAAAATYPGAFTFPGSTTYPRYSVYEHEFPVFAGGVYSCKLSKNRIVRKLVAYDPFYWKGNIVCSNNYQTWFTNDKTTLGDLRRSILTKFLIKQQGNDSSSDLIALPADDFPINRITDGDVTVGDLLRQIGEFNGCFMFMSGEGKLEYIFVGDNQYLNDRRTEVYDYYMDIETEDYSKVNYDGLYITGFNGGGAPYSIGAAVGDYENLYFMEDNRVITSGYTARSFNSEYINPSVNYGSLIKDNFAVSYTPIEFKTQSRLWVQVGDRIKVNVKWYDLNGDPRTTVVESIVLSRRISGIQALTDEIKADGERDRNTEDTVFEEYGT